MICDHFNTLLNSVWLHFDEDFYIYVHQVYDIIACVCIYVCVCVYIYIYIYIYIYVYVYVYRLPRWLNRYPLRSSGLKFSPWVGKIPWRRAWQTTSVFWPVAWRIPWTEEPGRLQSIGLQRVRHD